MVKLKKCIITFISCILSIVLINSTKVHCKNIYNLNNMCSSTKSTLLSEIPNEKIYLYALDSDEGKGVYEEILLKIKGIEKKFNWTVDSGLSFRPELILGDVNYDKKKELIVITTKDEGTGLFVQEIHIFDIDTFEEIKVDNPLDIISRNVKTNVDKNKRNIHINIANKKFTLTYISDNYDFVGDSLYFASNIIYKIKDNKLYAEVGPYLDGVGFIGTINIEYKFENNILVCNKISFKKIEDVSNVK